MMDEVEAIAVQLLKTATLAVEMKAHLVHKEVRRRVDHTIHKKVVAQTEQELVKALTPLFRRQIDSIIAKMGQKSTELTEKHLPGQHDQSTHAHTRTTVHGEKLQAAYRDSDGVYKLSENNKPAPEHVQKLGIPPAAKEVYVNLDPKGDQMAVWKDAKGRNQARYSDNHTMKAAADKFGRVTELRQKRKEIFSEIEKDVKAGTNVEEATCLKLIMKTGMRPGSDQDTKADHQSYGATTLEGRHVKQGKKGTYIEFTPGKKHGQKIRMPVQDPVLAAELLRRSQQAGPKGRLFDTTQGKVSEYSQSKDGGGFKTKDHRTALATETAIDVLKQRKPPKTEKEYKKAVKEVCTEVASVLGNTAGICFKSYVDPTVWVPWKLGAK